MLRDYQIQTLFKYAQEIEDSLKAKAPNFTGDLRNSIKFEVNNDATGFSIFMNDYGKFVDEGVNGTEVSRGSSFSFGTKRPPIASVSSFAKSIGANPDALATSIWKKGIRPTHFIQESIDSVIVDRLADELAESFWEDYYKENNEEK